MTEGQKSALGAIIRSLLLILFTKLGLHKHVDGAILGVAIDDLVAQLVGWTGAGLVMAWSLIQKWKAEREKKTALVMPPHATEADLQVVVKATSPGLLPTGPLPTPREAAAIVEKAP